MRRWHRKCQWAPAWELSKTDRTLTGSQAEAWFDPTFCENDLKFHDRFIAKQIQNVLKPLRSLDVMMSNLQMPMTTANLSPKKRRSGPLGRAICIVSSRFNQQTVKKMQDGLVAPSCCITGWVFFDHLIISNLSSRPHPETDRGQEFLAPN